MNHDRHEHPEGMEKHPVRIFTGTSWQAAVADVVREVHLEVHLNGRRMVTIACSGLHTVELAVGWLRGEGLIGTAGEIESLEVGREGMSVHVNTRPGLPGLPEDGGASPVRQGADAPAADVPLGAGQRIPRGPDNNDGTIISSSGARSAMGVRRSGREAGITGNRLLEAEMGDREGRDMTAMKSLAMGTETITPAAIFALMDDLVAAAGIHNLSRGTHGAALAASSQIFVTREDIGRHNCLDMLGGYTLLNGIDGRDKVLLRTGRVSSEIVHKVWRMGIPVVLSLSVPTALAISLAGQAGITLVGAIRAPSLTVYTHGKRIRES